MSLIKKPLLLLLIFVLFSPAFAKADDRVSFEPEVKLGVFERLGSKVPLDLRFNDENGNKATLKDLITGPTILSLQYFGCPKLCGEISSNLAGVIDALNARPGKDYNIITVSFDESNGPREATIRKRNYLKTLTRPIPTGAWRFLTADKAAITRLTEAVGFKFQRSGNTFKHPAVLIALSPDGRITRYLYGTQYQPAEVDMAIIQAASGKTGPTIPRGLLFCYTLDPASRKYVVSILRFAGISILFSAGVFLVWAFAYKKP